MSSMKSLNFDYLVRKNQNILIFPYLFVRIMINRLQIITGFLMQALLKK